MAPVALIRLCRREILRKEEVRTVRASTSRAGARREQSSSRRETSPGSGAVARAATIYSVDFLSSAFCERSRNCRVLDCARYAPIIRNAGALRRRFEATERKERVSGISRACSIGFSTWSSRSHSRNTSFRSPHSIVNTSERIDADVIVSCTPEKSTERGLTWDTFLNAFVMARSGFSSQPAQHSR